MADALGRGDRAKARELSQLLIKWGVAMGGFLSLGVAAAELLYPEALPHFFTEDQGIVDKVENVLWVIAIMQPINGLVSVGAGVLQGAQDFSYQVRAWGRAWVGGVLGRDPGGVGVGGLSQLVSRSVMREAQSKLQTAFGSR